MEIKKYLERIVSFNELERKIPYMERSELLENLCDEELVDADEEYPLANISTQLIFTLYFYENINDIINPLIAYVREIEERIISDYANLYLDNHYSQDECESLDIEVYEDEEGELSTLMSEEKGVTITWDILDSVLDDSVKEEIKSIITIGRNLEEINPLLFNEYKARLDNIEDIPYTPYYKNFDGEDIELDADIYYSSSWDIYSFID